jgi:hypothetical protein
MSLIGGYFDKKRIKIDNAAIQKKLTLYSIIPNENHHDYENLATETRFGHIVQKYKKNYPILNPVHQDTHGNLLITLGFLYKFGKIMNSEKLFDLCVKNSAKSLEECEGEFVSIFVEGHSGDLHIINDRFASRPFYILQEFDRIYFSSSLAFLLYLTGGAHEVDILGWLQVFSYKRTLDKRTTFQNIKRLRPSTYLTISTEGVKERQYWCLKHQPEKDLDSNTFSEHVFESFQAGASVRGSLSESGIIALSGGLDSRLVAAAVSGSSNLSAFTFVNSTDCSETEEVKVAKQVSHILELQHNIITIPESAVSVLANDITLLTDGLIRIIDPAKTMQYIYETKRRNVNYILGGGPGNYLSGDKVLTYNYLHNNKMKSCIHDFCDRRTVGKKNLRAVLALVIRDEILHEYFPYIKKSILETFENITGPSPIHRVTAWKMMFGYPSFTAISPIHNHPDVTEASCHLDYTYCELMSKLPAQWLYKRNFYEFMICNCIPSLREVVCANTGERLQSQIRSFASESSRSLPVLSRVKKLAKKVTWSSPSSDISYPFHYSLMQKDKKLFSEIAEILHSITALECILDKNKCLQFLENAAAGRMQSSCYQNDATILGSLATMCYSFKNLHA